MWLLVSYIFFYKDYTYVFLSDYSRYIYYFSKPWGCFVCICMCVIILNVYECFLSLEAVCVFVRMHVELGTLGCVGRIG